MMAWASGTVSNSLLTVTALQVKEAPNGKEDIYDRQQYTEAHVQTLAFSVATRTGHDLTVHWLPGSGRGSIWACANI